MSPAARMPQDEDQNKFHQATKQLMTNIYKKFTKDVGFVAISEIVLKLKPIIFIPIITKTLGASDYGVYATLLVTIALLSPISRLGLNFSIIRMMASEEDKKKIAKGTSSMLVLTFFISLLLSAIVFLSAEFLANTVFGSPGATLIIQLGSLMLPLDVLLKISFNFFKMRQRVSTFSALRIAYAFVPIVLAAIFLLGGHGLIYVIIAHLIAYTGIILASFVLMLTDVGIAMPAFGILKPYLKFGMPLISVAIAGSILNIGDRYVIGYLLDSSAVGIYSVAYGLGMLTLMTLAPINQALLAPLSKAYDVGTSRQVKNYLNYSLRYFLLFSIPVLVGLFVLSTPLTRSLTTSAFLEGSFGLVAVIGISNMVFGLYAIISKVLFLVKRPMYVAIPTVLAAALNMALNFLLIPLLGLLGAAIATLISFLALFMITFLLSIKHIRFSLDPVFVSKCVLAASAMGGFVYALSPRGMTRILPTIAIAALLYFAILFALRTFRKNEIRFFRGFLRKQEEFTALA